MKRIICILTAGYLLSGCAQITYNITINGDNNKTTSTGAVDKKTDDLMDLAGSAYGDAATNGGSSK